MKSLQQRFWSHVERRGPGDCWPWAGCLDRHGYGRITIDGRVKIASRIAWLLAFGRDAGARHVCHRCDNPACCNPSHLWLGTHTENMRDCLAKGRWRSGWSTRKQLASTIAVGMTAKGARSPEVARPLISELRTP